MSLIEFFFLALATCGLGIGAGAITDLTRRAWGVAWSMVMVVCCVALAIL